ncbi:MAG: family 10 glycosylhydrolase [Candidatus Sericytochromatia bacterium]|nr:family 10 glycosylhydrolase [Candidatus Sericytochromatia bacterium]
MSSLTRLLLSSLVCLLGWMPHSAHAQEADPSRQAYEQALIQAKGELKRIEGRLESARVAHLDVPLARAGVSLSMAKMAIETAALTLRTGGAQTEVRAWLTRGEGYLREAALHLLPSRGAETRGILLDASSLPRSESGIVALVQQFARAHFNVLLPEVCRRGYAIYPSQLLDRDPDFRQDLDVLQVLIREAHRRGMEVHPWIWTFRVRSPGFGNPLLGHLPALAARAEGKESRFLSAAHPDARDFVLRAVEELTRHYDVDGLLLDYIRYDEAIPEDEVSKTQFALAYHAQHGVYPPDPLPADSPLRLEWQLWREQQVHTTVQEIAARARVHRPHLAISAAVFRGEAYARAAKLQNWRHWMDNAWIDWPSPMLYTGKTQELSRWLSWETDRHTRRNLLVPILGLHRFDQPSDLFEQWAELRAEHVPGGFLFALGHFDLARLEDLRAGPFREPALLPHRSFPRAVRKTLAQVMQHLRLVHAQGDFEAAATALMLHEEVQRISQSLPLRDRVYYQAPALRERLRQVRSMAELAPWPLAARREFLSRMLYADALLAANQHRVEANRYVPPAPPPRERAEERAGGQGD